MKRLGRLIASVLLITLLCDMIGFALKLPYAYATGLSASSLQTLCDSLGYTTGKYWSYSGKDGVNPGPKETTAFMASSYKANTSTSTSNGKAGASGYYGYAYFTGSNNTGGRWRECAGFALYLGYKLTGCDPVNSSMWTKYSSFDAAGELQVGDIVAIKYRKRTGGTSTHMAMVFSADNGKYTFIQASGGSNNQIRRNAPFYVGALDAAGNNVSACKYTTVEQLAYIQCGTYSGLGGAVVLRYNGNSGGETTGKEQTLFTISAVFRNTEWRHSHEEPYLDSPNKSIIYAGKEVTVKRFVKNSHGNIWAELSDGSYLCFYDKDTGENKMQFVRMTSDFKVTGTDGYVPTGKRSVSSCALRGKITGDVPMLYVTARVVNRSTGENKISVTANMQMGVKTIDINSTAGTSNKVNINNSMPFKKVDTDGYYRYEVAVQLGFTYNGRTFKFGSEQIAIKSEFWIGNPVEDEDTLPDVGGTQIGTTTRKPGDVNDDGYVDMLDVIDYMDWYCGGNISINLLNADVTGDGVADMLDIITIMDWYCGGNVDFV